MKRGVFLRGIAALSLSACAEKRTGAAPLRIVSTAWHPGLDPYAGAYADVVERSWLYGDGLVGMTPQGIAGRIAAEVPSPQNGGIADSARRVRYRLRANLRWQDGSPFGARDAVEAFHRLVRAHPMWKHTFPYSAVADIDARENVLDVRLDAPCADFVATFFSAFGSAPLPIVRPDAIGTGAFRLVRSHGGASSWERWDARARLANISYRVIPDSNSAVLALRTGEADVVLPADRTLTRGFRTIARRSGVVYAFANTRALTRSERTWIFAAVDTSVLARDVYGESADRMLVDGVRIDAPRGARANPRRAVRVAYPREPVTERLGALLCAQLRAKGIDVRERALPLFEYDEFLRGGRFDVALYGGQYAVCKDLYPQWSCRFAAPHAGGYARLCDPLLDRAMRTQDAAAIGERLTAEAAVLPIAQYDDIAAIARGVRIPLPRRAFVPWFSDIADWSFAAPES